MIANLALKAKDKLETAYLHVLYAKDAVVKGVSTAATWAQTAAMTAWNGICAVGTAVTTALGAAFTFLTSPIGLVILAIAAVVAIGVLLYKNWDTVKEKASQLGEWIVGVFNNLKEKASAAIQAFADKFPAAFAFISAIFESWKQTISNVISGVKQVFQGIIQFFTGVFTGDWQKALDGLKNIFSGAFKALSSLAMAPLNALKGVVTGAFNAIDTATGGKLTELKNKASETWNSVKQTAGTVLTAAKDTISGKLSNIKSAYESHGGGIKGVAAAAMEGVKGYYTAGYSFINNLTGGKLDEVKNKFSEKMEGARAAVLEKFEAIKSGISQKLESAKTVISNVISGVKQVFQGIIQFFTGVFTGDWQKALDGLKNIFSGAFKALSSLAMAPLNALKGVVTGAFNAIDTATGGKLTELKNKASETWNSVKQTAGTVLTAAKDTISGKLSNIKSAYESHGGGIKGVAAAAMEGVKGYYTAGYSFINNLTGGKLDEVKNKFSEKMEGARAAVLEKFEAIKSGISEKLEGAKTVITNGLNAIKNFFSGCKLELPSIKIPHFNISGGEAPWGIAGKGTAPKISVDWYKDGGILTRPTIFGANGNSLLGGGEAGKEAVLPLSELWANMRTVVAGVIGKQPDSAAAMFEKIKQLTGTQSPGQTVDSVTKQLYNTVTNNNTVNNTSEKNTSNDSQKIVFSPQITIQGNASKEDVQSALEMSQEKFNAMMAEYQRQNRRTSFA